MDLVIFGASGPTGLLAVQQALASGQRVIAVTREPGDYPLSAPGLRVVGADVNDRNAVEQVMSRADAVISTFGVPYTRRAVSVYSVGIASIMRAMKNNGVRRLVCVSSTTLSTEDAPGGSWFWRKLTVPLLRRVIGRTLYDDMQRMEDAVRSSDLEWTIVRPGGLFDASRPSGDYEVAARHLAGRMTSRADLAEVLVAEATAPQHPRSIIEVITRSATPSFSAFMKEAFGGR